MAIASDASMAASIEAIWSALTSNTAAIESRVRIMPLMSRHTSCETAVAATGVRGVA